MEFIVLCNVQENIIFAPDNILFFSTSKPHVDKFANTPSLLDLPCKSAWRSVTTQAEKRYGVKHLISANVRILHANLRARARSF